jgi:hypothetical protein
MRAARILRVPTMRSRDILHPAKRDHLDRVHSDQMVFKMIGVGGVGGGQAKSLKTRVKEIIRLPLQ